MVKKHKTEVFIIGVNSPLCKRNYETNKTKSQSIDHCWSSDFLDMKDYKPAIVSGFRYVLIVIDNYSNFGWTVLLEIKYARTTTGDFSRSTKTSKRQPDHIETDDWKEYVNKLPTIY